jgi:hypothetical protein
VSLKSEKSNGERMKKKLAEKLTAVEIKNADSNFSFMRLMWGNINYY